MTVGAEFYPATFPWDAEAQQRTHNRAWIIPGQPGDQMQATNQREQIEAGQLEGYEAYDYQNPYVWQSRNLLTVATLLPQYGVFGDTPASVRANIANIKGILAK